ncbi:MAG: hypothetical protein KAH99_02410 [Verrucomicrobia bacterium]|nr:hypothetical protein [Verrucomicrobiota bacterium]
MKKSILTISILCAASAVWAAIITDDFNRLDTAYSADGSSIGANWVNGAGADNWKIAGNNLFVNTDAGAGILYNNSLQTVSGNGTSFTLSADVAGHAINIWSGLVFNYQDENNYYYLRIKPGSESYQLISYVGGGNERVIVTKDDALTTFAPETQYTLTVTSDTAYSFDFAITEVGSSTVLNPTTAATDPYARFTGGYAGFRVFSFSDHKGVVISR